jgi:anthranilate/para-aminobenzoate synthase component II
MTHFFAIYGWFSPANNITTLTKQTDRQVRVVDVLEIVLGHQSIGAVNGGDLER